MVDEDYDDMGFSIALYTWSPLPMLLTMKMREKNALCSLLIIVDTCETPPDLSTTIRFPKGYVMEEEYKVGDRITYVCATGLIVNGTISDRNKTLTCLPGKTWDGSAPVCVGRWIYSLFHFVCELLIDQATVMIRIKFGVNKVKIFLYMMICLLF